VIAEELGLKLENRDDERSRRPRKIVVDKDNTTIIDGAGKKADIEGRSADSYANRRDHLRLRSRKASGASRQLVGGVAVDPVGAATEVEMKEKKARGFGPGMRCTRRGPRSRKASWREVGGPDRASSALDVEGDAGREGRRPDRPSCSRGALRWIAQNAGWEGSWCSTRSVQNKGATDSTRRRKSSRIS